MENLNNNFLGCGGGSGWHRCSLSSYSVSKKYPPAWLWNVKKLVSCFLAYLTNIHHKNYDLHKITSVFQVRKS